MTNILIIPVIDTSGVSMTLSLSRISKFRSAEETQLQQSSVLQEQSTFSGAHFFDSYEF